MPKNKIINYISKAIRIITVAPVCAAFLILILYFKGKFLSGLHTVFAIIFLSVFPLLSYPVSIFIKKSDRSSQRKLAIIFSVIGYICGALFCFLSNSTVTEKIIYLTYLFSGTLTGIFSFGFNIKASGHACGVAGPIAALCYFISPFYAIGIILLIPVYSSSIILKRHTPLQLLIGTAIPVICLLISVLLTVLI